MGEKLNLRQASYEGLQNVKRVEKITSPEYDRLAEEANKRIRKNQLKQAKAYAECIFARNSPPCSGMLHGGLFFT